MQQSEKLGGLQIGRAIAALTIAYDHSWHVTMPFPPGTAYPIPFAEKFPAVPLFFAISGFVICLITVKPGFQPLQFLIRRAFRIYPLWIATSIAFPCLSLVALGLPQATTPTSFAYALTLLPTDGYSFYDVGWSLQHEMAFYLLAALLVPRFGLTGLAAFLMTGIALDHLLKLPWYLHLYASYYPSFLAGLAAFVLTSRLRIAKFWIPVVAGGRLLIPLDPPLNGLAYSLSLFCLLIGLINLRPATMAGRFGVVLGDASYSIYLIHPLVFGVVYTLLQPPLPPIWSQELLRFGSLAIVCTLSIVSWKWLESPIIAFGNRITSRPGVQKPTTALPQTAA